MEATVEGYLPLVGAIARTVRRGLPASVEVDELINDGVIGLIAAMRRYDPSRGVGFQAYAGHRIRGAILDGLRERDPLPRAIRRAQRTIRDRAWASAPAGGIYLHDLDDAVTVPADDESGPESLALEADLRRRLWKGVAALPPRDREVLLLKMVHGLPVRLVAQRMSLSVARTTEIQQRGLARLRRFLEGEPMIRPRQPGPPAAAAPVPAPPAAGATPAAGSTAVAGAPTGPLESTRHLRSHAPGVVVRSAGASMAARTAGPDSGTQVDVGRARPAPSADVRIEGGDRPWVTRICRGRGGGSPRFPR